MHVPTTPTMKRYSVRALSVIREQDASKFVSFPRTFLRLFYAEQLILFKALVTNYEVHSVL